MDESKRREPVEGFCCSERLERVGADDVVPAVIFACNLPPHNEDDSTTNNTSKVLEFVCREPSCGALLPAERTVVREEHDEVPMDPNFFDQGYTLAGRTGFQVWTGTRIMIETLLWTSNRGEQNSSSARIQHLQECIRNGNTNILELGAGVGVVGCCLAAAGGHVLLTDLPTLVEHSVRPNLERNRNIDTDVRHDNTLMTTECPDWLKFQGAAVQIGTGWAATTAIDWKEPLDKQLSHTQSQEVDLIVASDCVFLVEMLQALLSTVSEIFHQSTARQPALILSFQRRDAKDGDDSKSFTTVSRVIAEVKARGWTIECLAWYPVVVGNDKSEVFLLEVLPVATP